MVQLRSLGCGTRRALMLVALLIFAGVVLPTAARDSERTLPGEASDPNPAQTPQLVVPELFNDVISREISVFVPSPLVPFLDAISREISVFDTSPVELTDTNSREMSAFMVIPLTLDTAYVGVLAPGQYLYFRVTTPPDFTLRIDLDHVSATAWTELYASFGHVPDTFNAEFSSESPGQPDQELVVPNTQPGTYYILARCTTDSNASASKDFHLLAQASLFALDWIKPTTVGAGVATIEFRGARFSPTTAFAITCPSSAQPIAPKSTTLIDAAHARVTFDFSSATPVDHCDAKVSEPSGQTAELAAGLQVLAPIVNRITSANTFPSVLRGGRPIDTAVIVTNAGNVDIDGVVALFLIPNDSRLDIRSPNAAPPIETAQNFGLNKGVSLLSTAIAPGESRAIPVTVESDTTFPGHGHFPLVGFAEPYTSREFCDLPVFAFSEIVRHQVMEDETAPAQVRALARDQNQWWANVRDYCYQVVFSEIIGNTSANASRAPMLPVCYYMCLLMNVAHALNEPQWQPRDCDEICNRPEFRPHEVAITCFVSGTVLAESLVGGLKGISGVAGGIAGGIYTVEACTEVGQAGDPNEKVGVGGVLEEGFVQLDADFAYKVSFENISNATLPAAEIRITDQLDPSLDVSTFRLRRIQFGNHRVDVPEGRSSIDTVVQLPPEAGQPPEDALLVQITGGIDVAQRKATWILQALDPHTRQLPADPALGFLPPNNVDECGDPPHCGEGFVEFTIKPLASAVHTGTVIKNKASIVFDYNDPVIACAPGQQSAPDCVGWFNTIDAVAPNSAVGALPPKVTHARFDVCWAGQDDPGGSGVGSYSIFVSDNDGPYVSWRTDAEARCVAFTAGAVGDTYRFYSLAHDNVGYVEAGPTEPPSGAIVPDATTTVLFGDFNGDGVADQSDFYQSGQPRFWSCLTPPSLSARCATNDVDFDGDVDLFDFAAFQNDFTGLPDYQQVSSCLTAPALGLPTECDAEDFDLDGDVDLRDFAAFQIGFGAPQ